MHEASFEKMRAFCSTYISRELSTNTIRVLDVGSGANRGSLSYRDLFPSPGFDYVGLDVAPGHNVDLVPDDPFHWSDIETESFDLVISGQTFEHNPYFWVTAAEIARVLVEGGLAVVIAPSQGYTHRFPLDCWRFLPDSWSAICMYVGLDLIEDSREKVSWRKTIPGTYWRDAMMVGRKPLLQNAELRTTFYARLDAIVATRADLPKPTTELLNRGPAAQKYEQAHTLPLWRLIFRPWHILELIGRQATRFVETRVPIALRSRIWRRDGRAALERGATLMPLGESSPGQADPVEKFAERR